PNLRVIRSGVVGTWLNEAAMVCHFNSSISIESYLLGKPAFSMDWLNTKIIREMSPVTLGVSYKLNSVSEFEEKIVEVSNHHVLTGKGLDTAAGDLLESWIHMPPQGAAREISEAIETYLQQSTSGPNLEKCRQMALYGSLSPRSLRGWFEGLGRLIFGPRFFEFLRNWVLTKNIGKGTRVVKSFNKKMIDKVLSNIQSAIQSKENLESELATDQDTVIRRLIAGSYKIKAQGDSC
ncbi:MAG: hypothetical protein K2P92_01680, partial [Bdellovibrionaceae bacterium]|nr:hypothetical protein [Pseudobdellovibrionaceae bacterium]